MWLPNGCGDPSAWARPWSRLVSNATPPGGRMPAIELLASTWPLSNRPSNRIAPFHPADDEDAKARRKPIDVQPTSANLSFHALNSVPGGVRFDERRLVHLYLNDNQLTALPESIGRLRSLWQLFVHNNQLRTLPTALGQLRSLWELDVHNNQLTSLPKAVSKLSSLRRLDLTGNLFSLTSSAEWVGRVHRLKLDGKQNPGVLLPSPDIVEEGLDAVRRFFSELEKAAPPVGRQTPRAVGEVILPGKKPHAKAATSSVGAISGAPSAPKSKEAAAASAPAPVAASVSGKAQEAGTSAGGGGSSNHALALTGSDLRLGRSIAEGEFAEVFRALLWGQRVAVKALSTHGAGVEARDPLR